MNISERESQLLLFVAIAHDDDKMRSPYFKILFLCIRSNTGHNPTALITSACPAALKKPLEFTNSPSLKGKAAVQST